MKYMIVASSKWRTEISLVYNKVLSLILNGDCKTLEFVIGSNTKVDGIVKDLAKGLKVPNDNVHYYPYCTPTQQPGATTILNQTKPVAYKSSGYIRNSVMIDSHPDICIIYRDFEDANTNDIIAKCMRKAIPVYIYDRNGIETKKINPNIGLF